eukprot:TRINITY_DN24001_c0_g1_i1.p1 TRINITY_DN24001_c0_g1~~TRINITY_DN24001_c0_g1_i1.p1  ORF type:complete len:516 (+),score=207.24 TRINITY_DN24001_c0_g1_i1:61-1608(+)
MCFSCLEENEQLLITSCSGERSVENGPGIVCYGPCSSTEQRGALVLGTGEYAVIMNDEFGSKRSVYGPTVEWMTEREVKVDGGECPKLTGQQYITVTDGETGNVRNVTGPTLFKPGPYEEISEFKRVYNLSKNEYLRIKDQEGQVRIEVGEQRVVPDPLEEVMGGVQKGVNIDDHHCVLVRNIDTGSLVQISKQGLFVPSKYQEIVQVQEKIILEEYQTVVYKDKTGKFIYVRGDSELRDFFLPPFCEIVKQEWSTDLRKEHTSSEVMWKFDRRPSYMNYEFNCRTVDNVELEVDVSFFWAIIDVPLLVEKTADAPGDTCTHARSKIIQEVSRIKLLDFLERFNEIIRGACVGDTFYQERGVDLLSVEVLRFKCASKETDLILQDIIKETADRLKKKERQKGENEVALSRLSGEIEEEKMKKELIELKKSHLKTEARIEGEAEGNKLVAFMERTTGKEAISIDTDKAIKMYLMLRKLDSVEALSRGNNQLMITPNDVNLSVGQIFPTSKEDKSGF